MDTTHKIIYDNSNNLSECEPNSIDLVVTSPPYPMIEMWDELFSNFNQDIEVELNKEDGMSAYRLMHEELNKTWNELDRCLKYGGIICINIGDATRKIGDKFQIYSNHSKIISWFENKGYCVLPSIIWRKTTNKPNKFMGSGMLPTSAYVTLEHEYILIFRKNGNRSFNTFEKKNRQESAYFWEERNLWFSDVWTDLKGISQNLNNSGLRGRSAAFPFELAYRLINMYSVHGDTVIDPFAGTGTTMIASMCLGRNSINYEIDSNFKSLIENNVSGIESNAKKILIKRLKNHMDFIKKRTHEKGEPKHESDNYKFKVMTSQEKRILFPILINISNCGENKYKVTYDEDVLNLDAVDINDMVGSYKEKTLFSF